MRALLIAGTIALLMPMGIAGHLPDCVPTSQVPTTYTPVSDPVNNRLFYVTNDGFVYEETNLLFGLQRGGIGLLGNCFPPGLPCLIIDEDPINDETCGHGPDSIIL